MELLCLKDPAEIPFPATPAHRTYQANQEKKAIRCSSDLRDGKLIQPDGRAGEEERDFQDPAGRPEVSGFSRGLPILTVPRSADISGNTSSGRCHHPGAGPGPQRFRITRTFEIFCAGAEEGHVHAQRHRPSFAAFSTRRQAGVVDT